MKIVKSLEECGLVIKDVSETIKMKQKNKIEDFLGRYQVHYLSLQATFSGNLLTGKAKTRPGEGTISVGHDV